MGDDDPVDKVSCCESATGCVFAKALLARAAVCDMAARRSMAEREIIECRSPVARTNCTTLAALLHERGRFALRLPPVGHPMIHAKALHLHCGGLAGMQQALGAEQANVHAMIGTAHERYGSLTELPWDAIVQALKRWQARPRRAPAP